MKLYELIDKLEELEKQGKGFYNVWVTDGEIEHPIEHVDQVSCSDQYLEIVIG